MTSNKPIAVVGTCFTDIKGYPVGAYDPVGRNIGKIEYYSGGVARNVALDCSNMGNVVKYISIADAGPSGDDMLGELHRAGVDVSAVLRTERGGSGVWLAVFNENGDVAGSVSQPPDLAVMEEHIRSLGNGLLTGCKALLLEIDLNDSIAEYCITQAEKAGIPVYAIVSNLSVAGKRKDLLARCQCFICNVAEAVSLLETAPADTAESMAGWVADMAVRLRLERLVVTMGADGAAWYDGRTERSGYVAAMSTQVVDTTGAGDAFFSACVCCLLEGRPLEEACRAGAVLASRVISSEQNACRPCPGFISRKEYM